MTDSDTRDITVTAEQRDPLRLKLNKLAVHWNEYRVARDMIVFTVRASEDQWHSIQAVAE